jgi:pimeloyl-ACP methyl ester carboxylesterase
MKGPKSVSSDLAMRIVFLLLLSVIVQACSQQIQPDLDRLYRQTEFVEQPPVIVIHGIMGARLADSNTGEEAWPGSIGRLAFSDYEELALEIDDASREPMDSRLITSGLADQIAGTDYYGNILQTLEQAGGYRRSDPDDPVHSKHREVYVFTYDWRQDNVATAGKLADLIDRIKKNHGDPELKVDLIAHSMGGLVTRYYLRYGRDDVLNDNEFPVNYSGARNVRRVILLGTPNLGSVGSLHAFIEGTKIGFGRIPTEVLATMPSVYQLFPHSLNEWLVTAAGNPLPRDIFDIDVWRRFQWSIFDLKVRKKILDAEIDEQAGAARLETLEAYFEKNLERARRFVWSLTVPIPESSYSLIVFGGDCLPTPAKLVVEEVNGDSEVRLWPRKVSMPVAGVNYDELMLEPGDGTVTKASLLARDTLDSSVRRHEYINFPLDYPLFLCEKHDQMTGNVTFQDNLLYTLLSP